MVIFPFSVCWTESKKIFKYFLYSIAFTPYTKIYICEYILPIF